MQLSEMILIATMLGLLALGSVLSRRVANRFYGGEVLEAQRPWNRWMNLVVILWTISFVAFNILRNTGRLTHPPLVILGVSVVAVIGLTAIWVAYQKLMAADEFIRKIQIEALALGFALSLVGIIAIEQLSSAGIIEEVGLGRPFFTLCQALATAHIIVYLRYR